ncbi:MAG: UDP-N-acetylglucosamine 2-epimerase [Chlorobium sp.]|nr:UDP-N-acetylglucosamine 2-epimerase [Chlorobium sp.]
MPLGHLCEPLDYAPFIENMKKAYLFLSDSGGMEAPALDKSVLVLRDDETDRPKVFLRMLTAKDRNG